MKKPSWVGYEPIPEGLSFGCAKKRTRTSTGVTPLAPQASASAIPPPSQGITKDMKIPAPFELGSAGLSQGPGS